MTRTPKPSLPDSNAATLVSRSTADLVARVAGDPREGDGRRDGGDVDDRAAVAGRAVGAHRPQAVLDAERRAEDVDLEHPSEVVGLGVDDQAGDLDARVVDEDVEPAELLDRGRDRGLPARLVGDVEVRGLTADALRGLRGQVVLEVADHHLRAGRGERLRHPGAEAVRAAGDERLPALEQPFSHLSPPQSLDCAEDPTPSS